MTKQRDQLSYWNGSLIRGLSFLSHRPCTVCPHEGFLSDVERAVAAFKDT